MCLAATVADRGSGKGGRKGNMSSFEDVRSKKVRNVKGVDKAWGRTQKIDMTYLHRGVGSTE